ncbi:MAG: hypothetical protein KAQ64_01950 [Candidatus Pacebacteria bacterium]|nr:hypothetical protein [Candidatus Paceibacterota bacterium]
MNEIKDEIEVRDPILKIADKVHQGMEKGRELDKRRNSFAGRQNGF